MTEKDSQYSLKLEVDIISPVSRTVTKPFKTLKVLRQWQQRADIDNNIYILGYREYMLNPVTHQWERFTVFGTTIVLFSELEREYYRLQNKKDEEYKASFYKTEDCESSTKNNDVRNTRPP